MLQKATKHVETKVDSIVKKIIPKRRTPTKLAARTKPPRDRPRSTHPAMNQRLACALILGGVNIYARCHLANRMVPALAFGKFETFDTMSS
jgi:hypothetical protein